MRILAEHLFDRIGLHHIADQSGGAVRVHITDCARIKPRFAQRGLHGGRLPICIGFGEMCRIGMGAIAADQRIDIRATLQRNVKRFQHDHCSTFGQHQPGTIFGKWFTRAGRIISIGNSQGAQCIPGINSARNKHRLGSTCESTIDITMFDRTIRFTDGHRR